jgi:acetate kinase
VAGVNRVLVVNAGSSSLKLSVIGAGDEVLDTTTVDHGDEEAVRRFSEGHAPVNATGHRIVHGGTRFQLPTIVDDAVIDQLEALTPLAPLHQPAALEGVRITMRVMPGIPAVACFDTAFHATIPDAAATYAIPEAWRRQWGLRRFGFHGLSHQWASQRAIEITSLPRAGSRIVVCHLGSGSSACAVRDGRSVDTTMGFTPMEGLVMATRSGTVDPGLVLWVIRQGGLDPGAVEHALDRKSGLAALSGTDGDLRHLTDSGDDRAQLAVAVWVHRLRAAIGAMSAALGGIDVLVFTGGVGEHQPPLRARTADGLAFLGVVLDPDANGAATTDADISAAHASCRTVVVTAREDVQIARQVRTVLAAG